MFEIFYNFCGWNQKLFTLINLSTNISVLPYFLQIITTLFFIGNFALYYIICCIYFYLRLQKTPTLKRNLEFWLIYNKMAKIGIIYTVFGIVYSLLKFSINLPRPFCSLPQVRFTTIADISHERCLSSFPSAHVGLALFIAYCLWPYLNIRQKFITSSIALMVCLSRITLAMHYPADILYSLLVLTLVIIIGNMLYKALAPNLLKTIGNIVNTALLKY